MPTSLGNTPSAVCIKSQTDGLNQRFLSGIAPVKPAGRRSEWIHMRWACPKFLRQTFHESARTSLSFCGWAQCYYQMQLQRGKGRHAAFRALAFKWQRIMWRSWQDRTPYDDT